MFRYLVRRLFASWNLPAGGLRYYRWQVRPGALARTLAGWPAVRVELDAGRPVPLGVVKVRSWDPRVIGRNHQMLATGYESDGTRLRVWVYDPNYPGDDTLSLELDAGGADADGPVRHGREGATVRGFFRTRYAVPAELPAFG